MYIWFLAFCISYLTRSHIISLDSGEQSLQFPLGTYQEYDQFVAFSTNFTTMPVLAIAIQDLNYDYQVGFGFQTFAYGLNISGFNLAVQGVKLNRMNVSWIAFDPAYGFAMYYNQTNLTSVNWGLDKKVTTLQFPYTLNYTPTYSIFLNGIGIQIGDINSLTLSVISTTQSSITIQIMSSSPTIMINWVSMCIVVGIPDPFYSSYQQSLNSSITFNITNNTDTYFYQKYLVGFSGYYSNSTSGVANQIVNDQLINSTFSTNVQPYNTGSLTNYSVSFIAIRSGCYGKCTSCSITAYNCSSCQPTRNISTVTNTCPCSLGYYELIPEQVVCNLCDLNCQQCNIGPQNCTSCDILKYRILSNQTNKCICQDGFYEIPNNQTCNICDSTCQTCSSNSLYCLTCSSSLHRQLNQSSCKCITGYYESTYQICYTCTPTCLSCQYHPFNCVQCEPLYHRQINVINQNLSHCSCQDGYYEATNRNQQINKNCQKCDQNCITCVDAATKCLSCSIDLNLIWVNYTCICMDINYNYTKGNQYCMNFNIEQLQRQKMSSSEVYIVDNLKYLSQSLFNISTGGGFFLYVLRRSTIFGLLANFDQPLAQFNYLNITYPLIVFEFERLTSIFIFDYVEDYLQENKNINYTLFLTDVKQDVNKSNQVYNFQRVNVTPLFILTGIDVLFSAGLYFLFASIIFLQERWNPRAEDNEIEALSVYRISEDINEQERQWVVWQARTFLRKHSLTISILNFLFFWILENKFAVVFASLMLQFQNPQFLTRLEVISFVFTILTLLIIIGFHFTNLVIMRSTMQKRKVLKDMVIQKTTSISNEIELQPLVIINSQTLQNDDIDQNNEVVINKQNKLFLERVTNALRQQEQRYIADLNLDKFGYTYHCFALLKKIIFVMICVLMVGQVQVQLWLLFALHLVFLFLKMAMMPYNLTVRNYLVIFCDIIYLAVLTLKINDLYNFQLYDTSPTSKQRNTNLAQFMYNGQITFGFEILFLVMSFILQFFIISTYLRKWCHHEEDEEPDTKPKRHLNLEVYEKNDFRRILLELEEVEQIRVLGNMTKIFRDGDMITDELLEIAFVFTCQHKISFENNPSTESQNQYGQRIELQGHYSVALKNANTKTTMIIYQIQRELQTKHDSQQQNYQMKDEIQLDLPVTLKPFETCYLHQYFQVSATDHEQNLKLSISYQRVIPNKKHQNLIIIEPKFAASINQILRNVDISDAEAYQIYTNKDSELVLKGTSQFVNQKQTKAYWSLVTQYLGFLIQGDSLENETMLAKFILPEIDSLDNRFLDVFLIVEKIEPFTITIQVWHKRFGQFTTYNNTQLYQTIIDSFFHGIIHFFSSK